MANIVRPTVPTVETNTNDAYTIEERRNITSNHMSTKPVPTEVDYSKYRPSSSSISTQIPTLLLEVTSQYAFAIIENITWYMFENFKKDQDYLLIFFIVAAVTIFFSLVSIIICRQWWIVNSRYHREEIALQDLAAIQNNNSS